MSNRVDAKVVLLGHEYVGKTSLIERFVYDRFRGELPYQNTIGAAYASKQVESRGKKFVLGIWDTAGSERYEAMSRIYYRGASAAIICYDVTNQESWSRAKFWVSELRRYEENCKAYLCGTKIDIVLADNAMRQVDSALVKKYVDGIEAKYIETSSKTGDHVAELFQMIADDFISNPNNIRKIEETIMLTNTERRNTCCGSSS